MGIPKNNVQNQFAGAAKKLGLRWVATAGCMAAIISMGALLASATPAYAGEPSNEVARKYDTHVDSSAFDDPETLAEYVANREQRDADADILYAPNVYTLADGTMIQPVPNDARKWNVGVIRAEERGCTACHSLEDAIEWAPISHNGLNSYGDDPLSVTTCIACHDGQQGPLFNRPIPLINCIHTTHMMSDPFNELNGNCMSCHYVTPENEYVLWDEVKYDLLQGFTELSDIEGEFTFDQDVLTDNNLAFYQLSASTNPNGLPLHSCTDNSILQDRVITIDGLVDNPIDLKLVDIPEDTLVTRTMKLNCSANGIGDVFIANAVVTGIPFSTICEMAGVTGDAVTLVCEEGKSTFKVDWLIEKEALLVFQMNGENLPSELGYPCALFTVGTGASSSRRYITEMQFVDSADVKKWKNDVPGTLVPGTEDDYFNKPVGAVINVRDGQIFTGTDTVSFEGYADGFNERVAEVSFSLDRGKTWSSYDTSSSTIDRWVYWTFTISNLTPGSYDLRVRIVTETGRVIPQDINCIFHIQ